MSEIYDASRARQPRAQEVQVQRRRRRADSLNRMAGSNLGVPEECLDPEFHYHWANDERGRLRNLTVYDDYDFVTADELAERGGEGFDRERMTTESDGRVSVVVQGRGADAMKAFLLKKPKSFYDHDYREGCEVRNAMMESRVYEGDVGDDEAPGEGKVGALDPDITYVPEGNTLGDAAPRRRGPIPRKFK